MPVSSSSLPPTQPSGARMARGPFALAVGAVYLASFVSQMLLSAPVTKHMSVAPFLVVQVALIGLWIVLHQRRLRDAGRPTGIVIGIAMIYAIEVVLMALLIWILTSSSGSGDFAGDSAGIFHLFVLLYLLGSLSGDPNLGVLQIWLAGFVAALLLPVLIAVCFSLWAATRPGTSSSP